MPKTLLTDVTVRNLQAPARGQQTHWDTSPGFNGFGLRVSQGGTKTWLVMAGPREKRRRFTLGRYPAVSLADARTAARKLNAELLLGQRPFASTSVSFETAVESYLKTYCLKLSANHRGETERILRRHFLPSLGPRQLEQLTTHHLTAILDPIASSTPIMANNAYACIKTFLRWCARRGFLSNSPGEQLQRPARLVSRDRVLAELELAAIYRAAQQMEPPFGTIVQLLVHLPLRKNEAAYLRWSYINEDAIVIPGKIRKNNHELILPNLIGRTLREIAGESTVLPRGDTYLFPSSAGTPFSGWSKNKARLDKLSGVQDWVLHDLRRTFASMMAEHELADPITVERILGHVSGTLSPIARIYNRHSYLPQAREALQKWEKHLAAITSIAHPANSPIDKSNN